VVALRGVVVDDVHDHLDASGMKGLDHLLELGDLLSAALRLQLAVPVGSASVSVSSVSDTRAEIPTPLIPIS
jgi:hypothetical protein